MVASAAPEDRGPGLLSRLADRARAWRDARIADPRFQAWATANPLTRRIANRQGAALYDLVAGFVYSQVLHACVELDLFRRVATGPLSVPDLAEGTPLPPDAMQRLAQAAASLDLLHLRAGGRYGLGPLGAALLGAPGVEEMVRHHPMFYRDIEDPVTLLTAPKGSTELSQFWTYVRSGTVGAQEAGAYSRLMAASQDMVAAETLAVHPMTGITRLMDVGGGEGAFLAAALEATPGLTGTVFDLPEVAARAEVALAARGLDDRATAAGGSFLSDVLPQGADAISLVRVLYDHDTPVVQRLLAAVFDALPPGGRVLISEPMSGGARPSRSGDAYFGFYTAAMTSGQPRAPQEHMAALTAAGFVSVRSLAPRQGFITRVIAGQKPDTSKRSD